MRPRSVPSVDPKNIAEVSKKTGGQVGYIHIPTWGAPV